MKMMSSLFKEDPLHKQLKKLGLFTDSLSSEVMNLTLELFQQKIKQNEEERFLKVVIKQLQQKTSYSRKVKIMSVLIQMSKISKYDICDIILNKKMKTFTKPSKHKFNELEPKGDKLQEFILEELLIPYYNFLMKLATNEELYHTCREGEIPFDDIFRRGTKIRFIWIFKLYNIINVLIPIVKSLIKAHQYNPGSSFFEESAAFMANDMIIMNNFVVKALEEASKDNYMLMPYFDMLQFYQSLQEQMKVGREVLELYEVTNTFAKGLKQPKKFDMKKEDIEEIQVQALRVKLISNSLKNPKKDHRRLQTQYNEKRERQESRVTQKTEPNVYEHEMEDFKTRWQNI